MATTFGKIKFRLIMTGLLLLVSTGCDKPLFRNDLDIIKQRGVLRVITRNNGTCFYEGPHGYEGFEYDLVQAFSEHLGLRLALRVVDNETVMVTELLDGNADLIAANFIITDDLRQHLAFGPVYQKMKLLVVGTPGGPAPRSVADLIGLPIWVVAGAYHGKCLNVLKKEYPKLSWLAISDYETEELLEMVWKGIIPLTIADSHTVAINRKYYPELAIHFSIDKGQSLAWVMDSKNLHLRDAVDQWFSEVATVLLVQRLNQHYYGHLKTFDSMDIKIFRHRLQQRLPRYRKHFEAAALENGLDWKLIAAQAYQESHWNPRARSFTGVRGLMMLTRETARDMGVKNRLDPAESIIGGTRYLAALHGRLGDQVPEPDRIFMALAAYNVGWGHLEDARKLAAQFGKDPNAWSDVRSTLPLLRLKKYYKRLPHGYARGAEPVQYVDRIRTYHEVLDHSERNFRNR